MEPNSSIGLSRLRADQQGPDSHPGTQPGAPEPAGLPRIGVVRNPKSHRNRGFAVEQIDRPNVWAAAPGTRDELAEALADFARQRIEWLVIDGGDGTVRDVLTRGAPIFGAQWPRIMVLPKGKTNALAADLGLPSRWPLADAVKAATSGETRIATRRPITIERPGCEGWQATGFILGTGVFNAAIETGQVAHRFGAFQGFAVAVTALVAIVQALFGLGGGRWRALSPMRMTTGPGGLEVAQSAHGVPGERFASGMSTLEKFPLGMRPFGSGGAGIRYLVFDAPLRRVVMLVPLILMGMDRPFMRRLGVHRGAAEEISMQLGGKFILDGEAFPPGSYRLRLGPELHFVVP